MEIDLAETLSYEDIPIKLRCASCNKLVTDALRLPCCDQNICGTCHKSLPQSCPICTHTPLSSEGCKANKSLRLTVKAFLKNEERKRSKNNGVTVASTDDTVQAGEPNLGSTQAETSESTNIALTAVNGEQSTIEPSASKQIPDTPIIQEQNSITDTNTDGAAQTRGVPRNLELQQPNALHQYKQMVLSDTQEPVGNSTCEDLETSQLPDWSTGVSVLAPNMQGGPSDTNWNFNSQFHQMMAMNTFNAIPWGSFSGHFDIQSIGMNPMAMPQSMFDGFGGTGIGSDGAGVGFGGYDAFGNWMSGPAMMAGYMHGEASANAGQHPRNGYNQQSHHGRFNQTRQPFSMNNNHRPNPRGRGSYRPGLPRDSNYSALEESYVSEAQEQFEPEGGRKSNSQLNLKDNEELQPPNIFSKIPVLTSEEEREVGMCDDEGDFTTPSAAMAISSLAWDHDKPSVTKIGHESIVTTDAIEAKHEEDLQTHPNDHYKTNAIVNAPRAESNFVDDKHVVFDTVKPPSGPAVSFSTPRAVSDFSLRGRGSSRSIHRFANRGRGHGSSNSASKITNSAATPYGLMGQGVPGAPTGPKAMRTESSNTSHQLSRHNPPVAPREYTSALRSSDDETVVDQKRGLTMKSTLAVPYSQHKSLEENHRRKNDIYVDAGSWNDNDDYQSRIATSRRFPKDVVARLSPPASKPLAEVDDRKSRRGSSSKQHASRQDRSKSRERRRRHHRSRSSHEGDSEDESSRHRTTYNEEERFVSTKTHRHSLETDRYKDRETRRNRREHDQPRHRQDTIAVIKTEGRVSSTYSAPAPYSPLVPTAPREFKIKDRSKWGEIEDKKRVIAEEGSSVDAHSLEREARNQERLLREQQKRQSLNMGSKRRRDSNESENYNNACIDRNDDSLKQRKTPRVGRRKASFYQDYEYGGTRADTVEREREEARWR